MFYGFHVDSDVALSTLALAQPGSTRDFHIEGRGGINWIEDLRISVDGGPNQDAMIAIDGIVIHAFDEETPLVPTPDGVGEPQHLCVEPLLV